MLLVFVVGKLLWVINTMKTAVDAQKAAIDAIRLQNEAEMAPVERTLNQKDATIGSKDATIETLSERLATLAVQHSMTAEKLKERDALLVELPNALRLLVTEVHKYDLSLASKLYVLGVTSGVIQMSMAIHRIQGIVDAQVEAESLSKEAKFGLSLFKFYQNLVGFSVRERWRASVQSAEIVETLNFPRDDENFVKLRALWDNATKMYKKMLHGVGPELFMDAEVRALTALPEETGGPILPSTQR
jgi:hypothetical protein